MSSSVSQELVERVRTDPAIAALLQQGGDGGDTGALQAWCDDACVRRYLRARDCDVSKAVGMLSATLQWRRQQRPASTPCPKCSRDALAHNMRMIGFDARGRAVLYTCFSQAHDRFDAHANLTHLTHCLETTAAVLQQRQGEPGAEAEAVAVAAAGAVGAAAGEVQEKWVWFVDFDGYGLRDNNPRTCLLTAQLLNHYPERLAQVVMYGAPWLFGSVWGVVKKLLNEVTASKVAFVPAADGGAALPALGLGEEVTAWLRAECAQNRERRGGAGGAGAAADTKRYWLAPGGSAPPHDPRAIDSFVASADYACIYPAAAGAAAE